MPTQDDNVTLNSHGTNAAIKFHLLDDEAMSRFGFKKIDDWWTYSKMFRIVPEGARKSAALTVDFWVRYWPETDEVAIDLLDDDFGQPYDYQHIEASGHVTAYTRAARAFVESQMAYLQDAGVISGHEVGDYV